MVYYLIILPIFFHHSLGRTWPLVLQWWEIAVFLLKHPNPFLAVFKPAALKTLNFLFPVTVVLEDLFREESGKGREDDAPASTPRPSLPLVLVPLPISKTSFPATPIHKSQARITVEAGGRKRPLLPLCCGSASKRLSWSLASCLVIPLVGLL